MSKSISIDGVPYIDSKEASLRFQCTNDYMTRFCRQGKVKAQLMGRTWYVEEASLDRLIEEQRELKEKAARELAEARKREYELLQARRVASQDPIEILPRTEVRDVQKNVGNSFAQAQKVPPQLPQAVSPILLFAKKTLSVALILAVGFSGHAFVISPYPGLIQSEAAKQAVVFVEKNANAASVLRAAGSETVSQARIALKQVVEPFAYVAVVAGVGIVDGVRTASEETESSFAIAADSIEKISIITARATSRSVAAVAESVTDSLFFSAPQKIGETFTRAYETGQTALIGLFAKEIAFDDAPEVAVQSSDVFNASESAATSSVNTVVVGGTSRSPTPTPAATSPATPQQVSNTYTTVINQTGVSEQTLTSALETTKNSLMAEILKYSAAADRATSGNFNAIALSQKISNLANATLTNVTANGILGLTNADIPDDITVSGYLQTAGGSLTGITTFTHAPTLAHSFGAWSIGATGTNYQDAALIVNPATAAADSNLLALAVNGSTKFLIDAEGDVFANSFTAVGGVTLATTTASTFTVENDTTLGDSLTDTTTINGTLIVTGTTTASTVAGNFGVGTTSPWARLSVAGTANAATPLFAISTSTSNSTTTAFLIDANGNVGVGTTSPSSTFSVLGNGYLTGRLGIGRVATSDKVEVAGGIYATADFTSDFMGSASNLNYNFGPSVGNTGMFAPAANTVAFATNGGERLRIDADGNVGIGTTTPFRKLSITDTVSAAQAAIAYDATRFAEFQVSSVGDLFFDTSGGDIFVNNDNFWVCDNAGCPALTATSTAGNLFVENAVTFGNGFSINQVSATELGVYSSTGSLIITIDEGL